MRTSGPWNKLTAGDSPHIIKFVEMHACNLRFVTVDEIVDVVVRTVLVVDSKNRVAVDCSADGCDRFRIIQLVAYQTNTTKTACCRSHVTKQSNQSQPPSQHVMRNVMTYCL